jgi:hypothetical protein
MQAQSLRALRTATLVIMPNARANRFIVQLLVFAAHATAFAAARPAFLPENRQPPRNVPSSER